jgi:hypothetical protein
MSALAAAASAAAASATLSTESELKTVKAHAIASAALASAFPGSSASAFEEGSRASDVLAAHAPVEPRHPLKVEVHRVGRRPPLSTPRLGREDPHVEHTGDPADDCVLADRTDRPTAPPSRSSAVIAPTARLRWPWARDRGRPQFGQAERASIRPPLGLVGEFADFCAHEHVDDARAPGWPHAYGRAPAR